MPNNNTLTAPVLTDITDDNFVQAYQQFIKQGDFISLTRQFEQGFKQTGKDNTLNFSVNGAKVSLLDSGVLLIEPQSSATSEKPSKSIVISSGIHGNETAPIEIVQQLISDIIAKKIPVKHATLFIMGNPVAMNISKRFQTENLNRLFCGKHQEIAPCFEKYRAEKLETYVSDFFNAGADKGTSATTNRSNNSNNEVTNYHYDLHTAIRDSKYEKFAIYPYQGDKPWDKEQLTFMAACGVNTILFGHGPSGTFSYFSSAKFSAHAFTVELGKVRPFGENNMANFQAMTDNLSALICGNEITLKSFNNKDFNLFKVLGDITKVSDDFKLFIGDEISNFTDYPVDTLLSTDTGAEYRTTQPGESIVFPNAKVGNGQRAVLMVVPTTLL
ncbi:MULTISPECIES: succinylglutamate desuccinylase [Colwellia]|uniref:Succinylglutamate desuccinylase n=1 Tax=Colwellia marinimaniae TaxID=1513592 RepID=A0ABQ0MTY3_9GAMM|nr:MULTISPECIES: succinylglutamate desuccinylase [Colwellia]GAW95811.1 succinylglutamate desuccinylase [Colwellia marinimaniae]